MSETLLVADKILTGEVLYSQAIDLIIKNATHELLIFDQDLSQGGFSSVERHIQLQQFLSQNPAGKVEIILHDSGYFLQNCPRLLQLLKFYRHRMSVHITDNVAKNFQTSFAIADRQHFIKRIHFDHARFKFGLNQTQESAALYSLFLEISACASEEISMVALGL